MNAISRLACAVLLSVPLGVCDGESRPQKTLEPKFFVGCPVIWSDGSQGVIVERPVYRNEEWYYVVQLGGNDGLCWTLPEAGLKILDQASGHKSTDASR